MLNRTFNSIRFYSRCPCRRRSSSPSSSSSLSIVRMACIFGPHIYSNTLNQLEKISCIPNQMKCVYCVCTAYDVLLCLFTYSSQSLSTTKIHLKSFCVRRTPKTILVYQMVSNNMLKNLFDENVFVVRTKSETTKCSGKTN